MRESPDPMRLAAGWPSLPLFRMLRGPTIARKNSMKRRIGPLLIAAVLAALVSTAQAKALTPAALEAWLQRYGAAWESRDPAAAGKLFLADASYHEMPFDAPKQGRAAIEEYWRKVTADQRDVKF